MSSDRTPVRAVELWRPHGEVMALGAGAYRGHDALATASTSLQFHYGEGLPGAVWASGKALLWKDLAGPFARAELASEAGIDAALGCPLFEGDRVVAVLTLLLSRHAEAPSCVELWDVVDELDVLKHAGGYYLHCAELERFSPYLQFPRGTGLPGLTWLGGEALVMEDVRQSNAFIRAGLAARSGLKSGLGIPIYRARNVIQVLTIFGAESQSLLAGVEQYHPRGRELGAATVYDWSGRSPPRCESSADAPYRALALQSLASGAAELVERGPGREVAVALPLFDRKGLRQLTVIRF